ncbi:hypothetical protein V1514DRAFT_322015 [Lipomyces japonicus]|uniref:uncharacterized protein n=1 Tax=Lipomyces japonicus TaxID=56871 RepID=UPI0034CED9DE
MSGIKNSDGSKSTSSASSEQPKAAITSVAKPAINYAQVASRHIVDANKAQRPQAASTKSQSTVNGPTQPLKKPVAPASVAPAVPNVATSNTSTKPTPAQVTNGTQPHGQGHSRKKSTSQATPSQPSRKAWASNGGGIQLPAQQQHQFAGSSTAAPIQFGSINSNSGNTTGSRGTGSQHQLSNSSSPVPSHVGLSGGVPQATAVPPGNLKFGSIPDPESVNGVSSANHTIPANPPANRSGDSHMPIDTAQPATIPDSTPNRSVPLSPRGGLQTYNNTNTPSQNHNNFGIYAQGATGQQQPRGSSNGRGSFNAQHNSVSTPVTHKPNNARPQNRYNGHPSPNVTPQIAHAQVAVPISPQNYYQQAINVQTGYSAYGNEYYHNVPNAYGYPVMVPSPVRFNPLFTSQQLYASPARPSNGADQSPSLSATTIASPQSPAVHTPKSATKSRAIKIVDPTTNVEVDLRDIKKSSQVHSSPLPTRTASPAKSSTHTPADHKRSTSNTPVLTEEERRERAERAKNDVIQKFEEAKQKTEEQARKVREAEEEAERVKKEKEERLKKEEEERLKKEEEERLKKEEEERLKQEEADRLKKAEEERVRLEAEAKVAADAAAAAAAVVIAAAAAAETKAGDETPASTGTPATPESISPKITASIPVELGKEVSVAVEVPKVNEFATARALKKARYIDDISSIHYPSGIRAPKTKNRRYDFDFLLQFAKVLTAKPVENWDEIIKATIGDSFDKRPSANRSYSGTGRSGSRGNAPSSNITFAAMGQLGNKSNLLTSEQRFSLSNRSHNSGDIQNPFALGRTPSFGKVSGSQISNVINSMPSNVRNSRGQNGGRGKKPSARDVGDKLAEARDALSFPEVPTPVEEKFEPLVVSANRWKPRKKEESTTEVAEDGTIVLPPDVVQRKVNGLLNKMTVEKFDKISDQILDIVKQAKHETDGRTLRQVIALTFEKATDEAHWSNMYARFCQKVQNSLGDDIYEEGVVKNGELVRGGALFRKYLLSRCQEQFSVGWQVKTEDGAGQEVLSDEYYKAAKVKRRGLGLVRFIGELYLLSMISSKTIVKCIQDLLQNVDDPSEEQVESLCNLLRTVGARLDSEPWLRDYINAYFDRLKPLVDSETLPSRIRYMILDLFDLRKAKWVDNKNANKGPKTLQEIHQDALREIAAKEAQKNPRSGGMRFK